MKSFPLTFRVRRQLARRSRFDLRGSQSLQSQSPDGGTLWSVSKLFPRNSHHDVISKVNFESLARDNAFRVSFVLTFPLSVKRKHIAAKSLRFVPGQLPERRICSEEGSLSVIFLVKKWHWLMSKAWAYVHLWWDDSLRLNLRFPCTEKPMPVRLELKILVLTVAQVSAGEAKRKVNPEKLRHQPSPLN